MQECFAYSEHERIGELELYRGSHLQQRKPLARKRGHHRTALSVSSTPRSRERSSNGVSLAPCEHISATSFPSLCGQYIRKAVCFFFRRIRFGTLRDTIAFPSFIDEDNIFTKHLKGMICLPRAVVYGTSWFCSQARTFGYSL